MGIAICSCPSILLDDAYHFDDTVLSLDCRIFDLTTDDGLCGGSDVDDDTTRAEYDDDEGYEEAINEQKDVVRDILWLKKKRSFYYTTDQLYHILRMDIISIQ